jgi:HemY protein
MIRLTLGLFLLLCVASLAAWVANIQGEVQIVLAGYQLVAPAAGLIGVVILASLAALLLGSGLRFMWTLPARMRAKLQRQRAAQGELAMAEALMALARGDAQAASQATALARQKLPQKALPRLLAAQASILQGAPEAAAREYQKMIDADGSPQQKILGLEGLFYGARRRGDETAAAAYAAQVLQLAPHAAWALDGLMAMAVRAQDWASAEDWLRRWARSGQKRELVRHRRSVVYMAQAQAELALDTQQGRDRALQLANKAHAQQSEFLPAIGLRARLHAANGNASKARRVLRQAWARYPHVELAEAWLECYSEQPASTKLRAVSSLTGKNPKHEESYILRARVALSAQRWSLAQTLLQKLIAAYNAPSQVPRRLCQLMAEAEAGAGDMAAAQSWQDRVSRAPLEAGWVAAGLRLQAWQAVCPVTGNLGTVFWGVASQQAGLRALGNGAA